MSEVQPSGSPGPVRAFVGAALIAVGVLIMALCGGCGAIFFAVFFVDAIAHPNDAGMMLMPLFLGGVPAAIGFGLFLVGRELRRRPPPGETFS